MKKSASSRKATNVPDFVGRRLHTYTLAATAVGVTMLALAPPGEAEIIYTPTNQSIDPNGTYPLDLTGDGTTDFNFVDFWKSNSSVFSGYLAVEPGAAGNAVALTPRSVAAPLQSGTRIGPKTKFWGYRSVVMAEGHESSDPFRWHCFGAWKNKENRYLGLKFVISGQIHYGWARLSESCDQGYNSAVLTGYAYETISNQAIKAGEETGTLYEYETEPSEPAPVSERVPTPATLGLLAKGAPVLSVWRQSEN